MLSMGNGRQSQREEMVKLVWKVIRSERDVICRSKDQVFFICLQTIQGFLVWVFKVLRSSGKSTGALLSL